MMLTSNLVCKLLGIQPSAGTLPMLTVSFNPPVKILCMNGRHYLTVGSCKQNYIEAYLPRTDRLTE